MERKKAPFYYSQRLRRKLERMMDARVTLVEAGAGCGKTTAVREAFKACPHVYWHTMSDRNTVANYIGFNYQIAKFCPEAAHALRDFRATNRFNASAIAAVLSSIQCPQPTYFVLDNFQYILPVIPQAIVNAILNLPERNLHIVVIGHDLRRCLRAVADPDEVLVVEQADLMIHSREIAEYYALAGMPLTTEQARTLEECSEGWMVALSLHLDRCLEAGRFVKGMEVQDALTTLIWDRLSEEDQHRLMVYSFFESLTEAQICELEGADDVPKEARLLLSRLPLVRHIDKNHYQFHTLLCQFLTAQMALMPPERLRAACRRAGEWYKRHGDTLLAIACYNRCGDDEGILSLDLVGLFQSEIDGVPFENIIERIASTAAEETMARHPIAMLRIAYFLFGACKFARYEELMMKLRRTIERLNDPALMGEWVLMDSYSVFPDLNAMGERYRQAARLIGGSSRAISPREPYMFGCPSMWMLFYSRSGDMERNGDLYSSVLTVYAALTSGHGSGADELYRGECHCVQARYEEAEICAYKAAYQADAAGQITVAYGAAMLLGIISIYRNDIMGLEKAIQHLEAKAQRYAHEYDTALNTLMLETVRGYLLGLLLQTQSYPPWVSDDGNVEMNLTFVNFMIYQSRITDLVLKKQYKFAIARIEVLLRSDPRLATAACRNFMHAGLALCYLAIGRINKAAEALDASLALAAPDRNYTFLARLRKVFAMLFMHPRIVSKHKKAVREIRALRIDYAAPDEELVFKDIKPSQLPNELTPREREVALMAAGGMRNKEIALALSITEATVKSHMNVVFQKLFIDRRSKILEILE